MISHSHEFIFIHILKTGGTSVEQALRPYGRISYCQNGAVDAYFRHHSAQTVTDAFSAETWGRYFTFSFVRNPWARLVSQFAFNIMRGRENPDKDFEEWLADGLSGRTNIQPNECVVFPLTQLEFLTDADGTLLVDFVGKYEQLQQDFDSVCRRIGVPPLALPHANETRHAHYREHYTETAREMVAKHFRADIEAFGYEF